MSFPSVHKTFATGGSEGFVNIWSPFNEKRLCRFPRYPTGITSLAFSNDGTTLAVASSYVHAGGYTERPEHGISTHHVTDTEAKPKSAWSSRERGLSVESFVFLPTDTGLVPEGHLACGCSVSA